MKSANRFAGLGMLTIGLGVGAALAATPVAAAPDSDPYWPAIWPTDVSTAAPDLASGTDAPASGANLAISLFGIPLVQEGSAQAQSAAPGLAVAYGADSHAAAGGLFNIAFADGANSQAGGLGLINQLGGFLDTAFANGDDSSAMANGFLTYASADGTDASASVTGVGGAAFANGAGSAAGAFGLGTSAAAIGDHAAASAFPGFGAPASPLALFTSILSGAYAFGDNVTAHADGSLNFDIEPLFSSLGLSPSTAAGDAADGSWLTDLLDGSWLNNLF